MEISTINDSLNYNYQTTTLNETSNLSENKITSAADCSNVAVINTGSLSNLSNSQYQPPSQTVTISPWSNIEYTNFYDKRIEEIKDYSEEEIKRINDNIESVVKLMKNAKEDTQAFNNLLQSLIGRKQAMVDILKIIEKENNI